MRIKAPRQALVTFERRLIDPNRLYGVVVAESDSLLLLQREYDFEFDGYIVIRRKDISRQYSSESNSYGEVLMRKEGQWKTPSKAVHSLPLNDWFTLLKALSGQVVVIENERKGDFFIGPVVNCDSRAVEIHYFDGCGKWQKIERVPYRAITSVQFGSRYVTVHARHISPRPNESGDI